MLGFDSTHDCKLVGLLYNGSCETGRNLMIDLASMVLTSVLSASSPAVHPQTRTGEGWHSLQRIADQRQTPKRNGGTGSGGGGSGGQQQPPPPPGDKK